MGEIESIHKNQFKIFSIRDINFRQQANYSGNDKNIFQLPLMQGSRL